MLGYDKVSRIVEWLLLYLKVVIEEVFWSLNYVSLSGLIKCIIFLILDCEVELEIVEEKRNGDFKGKRLNLIFFVVKDIINFKEKRKRIIKELRMEVRVRVRKRILERK